MTSVQANVRAAANDPRRPEWDAVVVGSGPNGLVAAVMLARQGKSVLLIEAAEQVGGGMRTAELTLPGFQSDICSAVHPLGYSSPIFRALRLEEHGLEWVQPELPLAHPFDDGAAAELHSSLEATVQGLGRDGAAWERLMSPYVRNWEKLAPAVLSPVWRIPRHPLLLARFGFQSLRSAAGLSRAHFKTREARALLPGIAAHSMVPLDQPLTASFGLVLAAAAQAVGWPIARGGSQSIANALANCFRSYGGQIQTGFQVRSLDELPPARAVLFDVTPPVLLEIAGDRLPGRYVRRLEKFRHGAGVFKIDWALDGPIPWKAEACRIAGTVHLGGTLPEMASAERAVAEGRVPPRPYVLLSQQSRFDRTRVPGDGQEVAWAYCHVPHGCDRDMTAAIEMQVERFAPGFRERIIARHATGPAELEAYNANYIGGDITGGAPDGTQLFMRPTITLNPYRTGLPGVYLCSSSTPPGPGVHGMCGYWAARSVLRRELRG